MTIIERLDFLPSNDDPDDFRPNSSWACAVDPATPHGAYVRDMSVFIDRVAPGDRVPLHIHGIDELVVIQEGVSQVQLGEEVRIVPPGALVFIPAGVPHGGGPIDGPATYVGIFAADIVSTTYLERNPPPGTEDASPQPATEFNARSWQ